MKVTPIKTHNPKVDLVQPDITRDSTLGVQWLQGTVGRETLRLMGVSEADNKPSTLSAERRRVHDFISRDDQLNWMIAYENQVVGAIWVDLETTEYLPSPAVHIMIGNPQFRSKGIGSASLMGVIEYLKKSGEKMIYSRQLIENVGSSRLLHNIGFKDLGVPYSDKDGLQWQNVSLALQ